MGFIHPKGVLMLPEGSFLLIFVSPTSHPSAPRIVRLPETTRPDALVASFIVKENENLFRYSKYSVALGSNEASSSLLCCRGVSCLLLPSEDPAIRRHFILTTGIPTAIKGETRCDLRLRKKLDYESRASFVLQVLAEVR